MKSQSVADVLGPWKDPEFISGLIERCRQNWSVPMDEISNHALATFLRQRVALDLVMAEAQRRHQTGFSDDSEWDDEELAVAITGAILYQAAQ